LEPYKIVVDGPFVQQALQSKLDVREQLTKLVSGGRITPVTTGCILHELRNLGPKGDAAFRIAKTFYRVKCGHNDPLSAAECLKEQLGTENERRFFVATQDVELARHVRSIPGVPLIRMNHYTPLLEEPSTSSKDVSGKQNEKALEVGSWERKKLPVLAQKEAIAAARAEQPPIRRKGPRGVNPLSCLKPKKDKAKRTAPRESQQQPRPVETATTKPKRVRSKRMGTRTSAEVEAKSCPPNALLEAGVAAAPDGGPVDVGGCTESWQQPCAADGASGVEEVTVCTVRRAKRRRLVRA